MGLLRARDGSLHPPDALDDQCRQPRMVCVARVIGGLRVLVLLADYLSPMLPDKGRFDSKDYSFQAYRARYNMGQQLYYAFSVGLFRVVMLG